MRLLALTLCMVGLAVAQNIDPSRDPSLPRIQWTGATNAITVQANTANAPVYGEYLSIQCAADATITVYWNSAAATATAGTWLVVPGPTAPKPDIFTSSNFSGGTTGFSFAVLAGTTLPLNISNLMIQEKAASSRNFSFKTNSGNCTWDLTVRLKIR